MNYLLDTNICIYIIKRNYPSLAQKIQAFSLQQLSVSSITVAELYYGAMKSSNPQKNEAALIEFLQPFSIKEFDKRAALEYGKVRNDLEKKGMLVGPMDLLIASHALSMNFTVVTNNEREFRRVEGLLVENWTK
ncbi:type II toxin-antitoxin system VapC family toxin [bacterium]|nr:type II toxin-antitoxin system VapC family toxin [bacterium]